MTTPHSEKINLSAIGKYGTLSELLKRNLSASLESKRDNNIIIKHADNSKSLAVVRTTRSDRFVTHFFDERYHDQNKPVSYWIFCRIDESNYSHYYILTHDEMDKIQTRMNSNIRQIPSGGVDCVNLQYIADHENRWDLITG
jgi:hypothetical protein